MDATHFWLDLVNDATIRNLSSAKTTINAIVPELALFTNTINASTADVDSNTICAGTTYANISAVNLAAGFTTSSATGIITSDGDISFPTVTPADWGTITSVAIIDITSGLNGFILFFDILSPTVSPAVDSVLKYSSGNLSFTGT